MKRKGIEEVNEMGSEMEKKGQEKRIRKSEGKRQVDEEVEFDFSM